MSGNAHTRRRGGRDLVVDAMQWKHHTGRLDAHNENAFIIVMRLLTKGFIAFVIVQIWRTSLYAQSDRRGNLLFLLFGFGSKDVGWFAVWFATETRFWAASFIGVLSVHGAIRIQKICAHKQSKTSLCWKTMRKDGAAHKLVLKYSSVIYVTDGSVMFFPQVSQWIDGHFEYWLGEN